MDSAVPGGGRAGDAPAMAPGAVSPVGVGFVLARGFSRVFWGLLATLVLLGGQATIVAFTHLRLPAYVAGSLLAAWGFGILEMAGLPGAGWRRLARAALGMSLLQVYFAPFFSWWQAAPQIPFYLLNVCGLLLAGGGTFLLANLLAAEAFRRLGHGAAAGGALAAAATVVITLLALGLAGGYALAAAHWQPVLLPGELRQLLRCLPAWSLAGLLLPGLLTLVVARQACQTCRRLAREEVAP